MATLRALVRWAVLTSLLAAILFIAAGSTQIPALRNYVAVLSALLLFTMVAVDHELVRERARPAGRDIDPGSRTASGFLFLVTVIFAALDVGRLHQSDSVPPSWKLSALGVFAAALILQATAMIVNPFFSPALRIQAERGHSLITRGPYRFLRHPGYLAMLIAMPASAVAIGSCLALIPAAAFGLVIGRRARKEDEFLKQNLSGYIDYMERVRGGLFPRRPNSRVNMEEYWFVARLSDRSSDWKEVRFSVDSEDYESACVEAYRVAAEKGYRDVQDSPCTR